MLTYAQHVRVVAWYNVREFLSRRRLGACVRCQYEARLLDHCCVCCEQRDWRGCGGRRRRHACLRRGDVRGGRFRCPLQGLLRRGLASFDCFQAGHEVLDVPRLREQLLLLLLLRRQRWRRRRRLLHGWLVCMGLLLLHEWLVLPGWLLGCRSLRSACCALLLTSATAPGSGLGVACLLCAGLPRRFACCGLRARRFGDCRWDRLRVRCVRGCSSLHPPGCPRFGSGRLGFSWSEIEAGWQIGERHSCEKNDKRKRAA